MKKETVKLKAKDVKDSKPRDFELNHANKLLSLRNSQWELADPNWKSNGIELAKVETPKK